MSNENALRERMAQLGAQFIARTQGEIVQLRTLCERLRNGERGALEELEHLAHRIHGTGATLGFINISDCAGRIERMAEDTLQAQTVPDAGLAARILEEIGRMESEMVQPRG